MPRSHRVYVVPHGEGDRYRLTGILMRRRDELFEGALPSFSGRDETDLRAKAQRKLAELSAEGVDLDRYTFSDPIGVRETTVEIHPLFRVKKQPVIGRATVPLRLSYAWRKLEAGGYQVFVPRFGGWFLLEDLSLAAEVLRQAVSSWLLGQDARWLYDFRYEGPEWVMELDAPPARADDDEDEDEDALFPTTSRVAENLAVRAKKGRLSLPMGESTELAAILAMPARTPPRSLLLVGPPGVGKTALVRRLAKAWSRKDPRGGRHPRLWSTSAERLLAGMVYLGMWQERVLDLIAELDGEGDYLYLGSLPAVLEPQPDGASIGEMLEPAVAAEQISILAECTPQELEHARRKHPSLVARFDVVRVDEPPYPRALELLVRYAERKGLDLHPTAARRLHQLLATFVPSSAFPGKGTRFLDGLATSEEGGGETRARRTLMPTDVVAAFSRATGLPERLVSDDVSIGKDALAAELSSRVIGQPDACLAAARVLVRFKAGLADRERPAGTLLFVGPTGVGKTELAKELARTMFGGAHRMVRVDMGEYGAGGAVRRLLDASPGSTSLARRVAAEPLTLVLLDEIEKAHPEVFDLLLGVLGEGRLTDSRGRFVDFRSTVVVMTSNLGVSARGPVGFSDGADAKARAHDFVRAVREHVRPELFPRIDEVVPFRSLGPQEIVRIVDLELAALRARPGFVKRRLELVVTPAAKQKLAELGYHPLYGARPLRRVIEERVTSPVAAFLAGGTETSPGRVAVGVRGEALDGALVVRVDEG